MSGMPGICAWCRCWTEEGRPDQWVTALSGPDQPVLACPLCPPGRREQIASITVLAALIVVLLYVTVTH
ncbi:hypothetical protein [Streptomyces daliensis]|uniref:Uncharacterized protein n=1 Tax=Streptomyces daliensis TaxID=299421 RepID=A0A8T4IJG0_9ACTN|nr:hypothetical protein [Streptomyces daliensis]